MKNAPVAMFVYNRPLHAERTIRALQANQEASNTDLFVFSDGPRSSSEESKVEEVRAYLRTLRGFKSIELIERDANLGLARSIIDGVTTVISERGQCIVLEDDLVTSPWFLPFMNNALRLYSDEATVASIHGYRYPVSKRLPETFFLRGADCWGWATWKRAWSTFEQDGKTLLRGLEQSGLIQQFDLDGAYPFSEMLRNQVAGRNDSWAVRWHASCFLQGKLTLYPGQSLVHNIGNDASGTHCADVHDYTTDLSERSVDVQRIELVENAEARAVFAEFLRGTRPSALRRAMTGLVKKFGRAR